MGYRNLVASMFLLSSLLGCSAGKQDLVNLTSPINRLERLVSYTKEHKDNIVYVDKRVNTDREIGCVEYTDLNIKGEIDSKDEIETWYGRDFYFLWDVNLPGFIHVPGFVHYMRRRLDGTLVEERVFKINVTKNLSGRKNLLEKTLNRIESLLYEDQLILK